MRYIFRQMPSKARLKDNPLILDTYNIFGHIIISHTPLLIFKIYSYRKNRKTISTCIVKIALTFMVVKTEITNFYIQLKKKTQKHLRSVVLIKCSNKSKEPNNFKFQKNNLI